MFDKTLKFILQFTHYEIDKKIFMKEGDNMKKFTKEDIEKILQETQKEVFEQVDDSIKESIEDDDQKDIGFLSQMIALKDKSLVLSVITKIKNKLEGEK